VILSKNGALPNALPPEGTQGVTIASAGTTDFSARSGPSNAL
jgi:hypothetical protein